jgi:hypothetical protein
MNKNAIFIGRARSKDMTGKKHYTGLHWLPPDHVAILALIHGRITYKGPNYLNLWKADAAGRAMTR